MLIKDRSVIRSGNGCLIYYLKQYQKVSDFSKWPATALIDPAKLWITHKLVIGLAAACLATDRFEALEDIYTALNSGPDEWNGGTHLRSMSVGDVVYFQGRGGEAYCLTPIGWKLLT